MPMYVSLRKSPTDTMKMLQTTETSSVDVSYYLVHSSCGTDDFQLLRSPLYVYGNTLVEFAVYFSTRSVRGLSHTLLTAIEN